MAKSAKNRPAHAELGSHDAFFSPIQVESIRSHVTNYPASALPPKKYGKYY